MNESDKEAFRALDKHGVELEIRPIATDPKVNLMEKI